MTNIGLTNYICRAMSAVSAVNQYFVHILSPVTDNRFLKSAEGETKVCCRTGYLTRDLWLLSPTRYRLRYAARLVMENGNKITNCQN